MKPKIIICKNCKTAIITRYQSKHRTMDKLHHADFVQAVSLLNLTISITVKCRGCGKVFELIKEGKDA